MSLARLAAGTVIEIEEPAESATWVAIAEPRELGDIGESGSFVDATHLSITDATRQYIAGLKDPPDKAFVFADIPADAGQIALKAAADAQETRVIRISLPATTPASATQATMSVVLNGWVNQGPVVDGAVMLAVTGKQSGSTTRGIPA